MVVECRHSGNAQNQQWPVPGFTAQTQHAAQFSFFALARQRALYARIHRFLTHLWYRPVQQHACAPTLSGLWRGPRSAAEQQGLSNRLTQRSGACMLA
jgi:hypothetical protein